MQRFDVFFKRVFSQYKDKVLGLLNSILPVSCGNAVTREPSVEVVKGALRIDKIYETDTGKILIIDFEEPFTLDSYFEILMHTSAHIHATSYYKKIISSGNIHTNYIPIIVSIKANKKHLKFLIRNNMVTKINAGIYALKSLPFFTVYLLVFSEMNVTEYLLMAENLCTSPEDCQELSEKIKRPELWEEAIKQDDKKIKKILYTLVSRYGEMLYLINPQVDYMFNLWRFSEIEAQKVAKDILSAIIILFPKEVIRMSVSEILTEKEVRDIVEALGIEKAINAVGLARVIDAVGIDKVIDAVGIDRVIATVGLNKVIATVGIEKVIATAGIEKVIDALGKLLNLSDKEKESLLRKYKKK